MVVEKQSVGSNFFGRKFRYREDRAVVVDKQSVGSNFFGRKFRYREDRALDLGLALVFSASRLLVHAA